VKILTVFGTRPEAIKLAPVLRELRFRSDQIISRVCVTAQHREMLDQVLELFGIVADYDLNLMENNQSPVRVASAVLGHLGPILQKEKPDWVVVQGDTTTTAAASLATYYTGSRLAHVEAGLRTMDKWQPFPEEINRRLAGVIADLHFAPTETARANLLREGVTSEDVVVTGNPVIDALHWAAEMSPNGSVAKLFQKLRLYDGTCSKGKAVPPSGRIVLVTAHRRETFGEPLENICHALRDIALEYRDIVRIVFPVHLNPNVRQPVHRLLGELDNILLTPPLDYLTLVHLLKRCYLVLTDSGGLQEEAPSLGVPVLVLRNKTERPEAVKAGTVRIVGTGQESIVQAVRELFGNQEEYERMARAINPYGDGRAAARICAALMERNQ
jgi:UDP-N-acetylglucosamine 2-epimerase (non-hydrolysing)